MCDNGERNLRVFLFAFTHLTCIIVAPLHYIYPHSHTAMRVFEGGTLVIIPAFLKQSMFTTFSPFSHCTLPAFSHGGRVHYLHSSCCRYATSHHIIVFCDTAPLRPSLFALLRD